MAARVRSGSDHGLFDRRAGFCRDTARYLDVSGMIHHLGRARSARSRLATASQVRNVEFTIKQVIS
jgi:hypothetical protein